MALTVTLNQESQDQMVMWATLQKNVPVRRPHSTWPPCH